MRNVNYPDMIAFRGASEHRKALEKLIEKGKAGDLSEAVRYCIEQATGIQKVAA